MLWMFVLVTQYNSHFTQITGFDEKKNAEKVRPHNHQEMCQENKASVKINRNNKIGAKKFTN